MLPLLLALALSTAHAVEAKDAPCRWTGAERVAISGPYLYVGDHRYNIDIESRATVLLLDADACGSKSVPIYAVEYAEKRAAVIQIATWSALLVLPVVFLPSAMRAKNEAADNLKAAIVEAGKTYTETID